MASIRLPATRNTPSGTVSNRGIHCGGSGVSLATAMPRAVSRVERFPLGQGDRAPERPLRQLLAERQTGQGVDRVVQVEQQLRPLHRAEVLTCVQRQPGVVEHRRECAHRRMLLDLEVTLGALVEMPVAAVHHVERHHRRENDLLRQAARRVSALPSPFCALTTTVSEPIADASAAPASGVPADFTETTTRSAVAADSGPVAKAMSEAPTRISAPCRSVSRNPWSRISAPTRSRPIRVTSAPAAASRPPT